MDELNIPVILYLVMQNYIGFENTAKSCMFPRILHITQCHSYNFQRAKIRDILWDMSTKNLNYKIRDMGTDVEDVSLTK